MYHLELMLKFSNEQTPRKARNVRPLHQACPNRLSGRKIGTLLELYPTSLAGAIRT